MSLCLSLLCVCLFVCLSVSLPACLSDSLSACLSACLLVCLSACLSVCLFLHLIDDVLLHTELVAVFRLPLETMKCKIVENLRELERLGVASASDGYQSIINSVAKVC